MRIAAGQRELSRNEGERFLAPSYACITRTDWLRRFSKTVLPKKGVHFWCKGEDGLWWLGKISTSTTADGVYLVWFWEDLRPMKLLLYPTRYTILTGVARGFWCLQVHVTSAFPREIQGNVSESRSAAVVS